MQSNTYIRKCSFSNNSDYLQPHGITTWTLPCLHTRAHALCLRLDICMCQGVNAVCLMYLPKKSTGVADFGCDLDQTTCKERGIDKIWYPYCRSSRWHMCTHRMLVSARAIKPEHGSPLVQLAPLPCHHLLHRATWITCRHTYWSTCKANRRIVNMCVLMMPPLTKGKALWRSTITWILVWHIFAIALHTWLRQDNALWHEYQCYRPGLVALIN